MKEKKRQRGRPKTKIEVPFPPHSLLREWGKVLFFRPGNRRKFTLWLELASGETTELVWRDVQVLHAWLSQQMERAQRWRDHNAYVQRLDENWHYHCSLRSRVLRGECLGVWGMDIDPERRALPEKEIREKYQHLQDSYGKKPALF